MDEHGFDSSMDEVMDETAKSKGDIVFVNSNDLKNACRRSAEYPDYKCSRCSSVYQVNAFYWAPDIVPGGDPTKTYPLKVLKEGTPSEARTGELKNLLQLRHEHVIRYFAVGITIDDNYCLLMKFCSGKTLTEFIESNKMHCSTNVLVDYTLQLASGLRYLHENMEFIHGYIVASALHYLHEEASSTKFVHGDITSSSIMMTESTGENLKIIDVEGAFQQPRSLRPSEKEFDMRRGSYYFMSPEMAVWRTYNPEVIRPTPDSPTDIYSLGCVVMDMYFASQGQVLWPDHDYNSIRSAMESEHPLIPHMPENLPNELKVLARQCLQINPSDRPTAATLLKYADRVYFKCAEDGIHYYLSISNKPFDKLGAFGVVHRVDAFSVGADFVKESNRELALKTFFRKLEQDEIEKIESTLLKLGHPNIVKYLATGFFENDRHFTIIMEWCSGVTLTDAAAAEMGLSVEMQKNYVNQLICGIHYLHMENYPPIVHKDLKGMNVVFSDENKTRLKICDVDSCSVSRKVEQQSVISRVRFTPGFVSPELLRWAAMFNVTGEYPVGRATDIWSLGAVVLEMYNRGNLPDIPPFQRGGIVRTTAVDANVDIPPIGKELLAFAAKCLVNEPGDRPSIEQLRDDFSKG
ncbi:putative Death-associated protein kinase 3 [Hypsibius exemplaris]|uniref:non-specific serine/threonine protein kinase n=1 Tax=Hypsibius exemplaris TaxID=2072580 RepID=A0A9X6RMQ3_HYPEX|nr:putative Death-associated protein kinase 3 [Hypsibius exemplaris]